MKWISVEDRLPNNLEIVLVNGESDNDLRKGFDTAWIAPGCGWTSWHCKNITHWMPLPNPPEVKNNES